VVFSVLATLGLVAATLYSLKFFQQVFQGTPVTNQDSLTDFNFREMLVMIMMIIVIVWLGLYPQPAIRTSKGTIDQILKKEDISWHPKKHDGRRGAFVSEVEEISLRNHQKYQDCE